jgi:hypothetical protein
MTGFKRLELWFISVCGLGAVPYILVLFIRSQHLPWLEKVSGLGQLLPTGLALLGTGLAELLTMPSNKKKGRDELIYAVVVFGVLSVGLWAIIQVDAADSANGVLPFDAMHGYAWASLILVAVCVLIAGISVLLATPKTAVAEIPANNHPPPAKDEHPKQVQQ